MYRKVLIDPTFSPLTVFFNQMKQHVTMIVCDKTAFKWGVTRYPRSFDHLWTCRFLPALVFPFSDPESVPDVHQIRDCVSAGKGFSQPDVDQILLLSVLPQYLHGRAFLSLHSCHYISCLYVGSFLQCLPDSPLRLSPWNHFGVCGTSFFKITVAESNGCYVLATYGLCVWGQPLFRRAFITCPIFSFSSQFTGRGHSDSEWVDWKAGLI